MTEEDQHLPDIDTLVIPAKAPAHGGVPEPLASPPQGAGPGAAAPCGAQGAAAGGVGSKRDTIGLGASQGVCPSGPTAPLTTPLGVQNTPAATAKAVAQPIGRDQPDPTSLVKLTGHTHPWKPQTTAQIADFRALWLDLSVPLAAIAKRYKAGQRTIQVWRQRFGLPGRDELARAREQGGIVADAGAMAMAKAEPSIMAPGAACPPPASGVFLKRPENPMDVPEIVALLADVRQEALKMTATSDLTPLRRKLSKLAALASASTPHNWASLHAMAQEQARALLWAERVETDLPKGNGDQALLRREAANQLMAEMKSVLSEEEQQRLGGLVKLAAARLLARARPAAPGDPPGTPPPARNGKTLPRLEP